MEIILWISQLCSPFFGFLSFQFFKIANFTNNLSVPRGNMTEFQNKRILSFLRPVLLKFRALGSNKRIDIAEGIDLIVSLMPVSLLACWELPRKAVLNQLWALSCKFREWLIFWPPSCINSWIILSGSIMRTPSSNVHRLNNICFYANNPAQ